MIGQEIHNAAQVCEPDSTLSLRVAQVVREQMRCKPQSSIGLPTGRTPVGVYRLLSQWSRQGELDWTAARCFGLDEYYEVDESESFRYFLDQNLYKNTNLPRHSRLSPLAFENYDQAIEQSGGLDLTILGIGHNGHIAFNEPGTPLSSYTHCVYLTESTRQANAEFFKRTGIPGRAITMGIQTILSSAKIILMASGKQKATILSEALSGPITEQVPASFLQLHNNLAVFTDFEY